MVRDYELGLVISPELNDEQLEAQILRIGQSIETRGGEIVKLDRWGRRRLAYPIEHHRDGYYLYIEFKIDSLSLRDVERTILVQENVLRHMITYRDPKAQAERKRREQEAAARLAANQAALAQQQANQLHQMNQVAVATEDTEADLDVDAEIEMPTPAVDEVVTAEVTETEPATVE